MSIDYTGFAFGKRSKSQRVVEHDAAQRAKDRQWEAVKAEVWARDEGQCRVCHKRVKKSLEVTAKRGEVCHIRSRRFALTKMDRRNLFLACHLDHCLVDEHVMVIVGTATFTVEGETFIDADQPLEFIRQ